MEYDIYDNVSKELVARGLSGGEACQWLLDSVDWDNEESCFLVFIDIPMLPMFNIFDTREACEGWLYSKLDRTDDMRGVYTFSPRSSSFNSYRVVESDEK